MIIVSNVQVNRPDATGSMTYDEFKRQAFSEQGLDAQDVIYININDIEQAVFDQAKGSSEIKFFSLNGDVPHFVDVDVDDWGEYAPEKSDVEQMGEIQSLLQMGEEGPDDEADGGRDAKVYVFGSSKGGTGKTFTSIISTYRYAKTHPDERIAMVDFDIIDGQVGISIHKMKPTMKKYFTEYQKGFRDWKTMREFAVKARDPFPQNVDFYLAPSNGVRIADQKFWFNVIENCVENYDTVIFDTGIDYINIAPISYAYKLADKVILVTTTSIKSVNSVTKQIGRLKGETPAKNQRGQQVFTSEDEIGQKLNVVITQMDPMNKMNDTVFNTLNGKANVIATFGVITSSISRAEYYGEWNVFDKNPGVNKALDDIMA